MKKFIISCLPLFMLNLSSCGQKQQSQTNRSLMPVTFDDVVFDSKLQPYPVGIGFGSKKAVDSMFNEKVAARYSELYSISSNITIYARKLSAPSTEYSKTVEFTFVGIRQTGFFDYEHSGYFTVNSNVYYGIQDLTQTHYKVSDITAGQPNLSVNANLNFDNVVYNNEITAEYAKAGFGLNTILKVITNPEVNTALNKLLEADFLSNIQVQKLPARNEHETKITRYTFSSSRYTNFVTTEPVASFTVDAYSDLRILDASPTFYEVSEIKY